MESLLHQINRGAGRILSFVLFLLIAVMSLNAQTRYTSLWKEWTQACADGLPQSQQKQLDKILQLAKKEHASAEYTEAALLSVSQIGEADPARAIALLRAYSEESWTDKADRALLKASLIQCYADTYEEYSMPQKEQRSEELSLEQIKLWSASQYLKEISSEWAQFIALSTHLESYSTGRYPHIFVCGNAAEEIKHNLRYAVMDMLHSLVDSKWSSLSRMTYLVHPEYMPLTYSEIVEGHTNKRGKPISTDDLPKLYLQELLTAEKEAPDPVSALVFKRLRYRLLSESEDEESLALYDALIKEFEPLIPHSLHLYEVYADKAKVLFWLERYKDAVALAEHIISSKPGSHAAMRANTLLCDIKRPMLHVSVNDGLLYSGDSLKVNLRYKEIEHLSLKLYRIADPQMVINKTLQSYATETQQRNALLSVATLHNALEIVPIRSDNYEYTHTTYTFASLPLGVYIIEAIPTPFDKKNKQWLNRKEYTWLHVSNVMRLQREVGKAQEMLLVDAREGKPLQEGCLMQWIEKDGKVQSRTDKVDSKGIVHYTPLATQWSIQALAYTEKDAFAPVSRIWSTEGRDQSTDPIRATFFTDRALYRPGQKVYFKGILYNAVEGQKSPLANRQVSVEAYDQKSGEEQQVGSFVTNNYGSFTGSFTLPSESSGTIYRLTLSTAEEDYGEATFRVEEYKRPTYEVKIDSLHETPYYGRPITLSATAQYYSSASVEGADVRYRLEAFPSFFDYYWYGSDEKYLIAEGNGTTDSKGRFSLTLPELCLSPADSIRYASDFNTPLHETFIGYSFVVTTTTKEGETHTASYFFHTGKEAVYSASTLEEQQPIEQIQDWTVVTKDYAGKELPLSGQYHIVAQSDTTRQLLSGFFESGKPIPASALKALPAGYYRLYMTAEYKGVKSEAKEDFLLFNLKNAPAVHKEKLFVYPIETAYSATKPATLLLSSSEEERTIYMYLFTTERDLRKETIVLHKEQRLIKLSLPKGVDKATVQFFTVSHGKVYTYQEEICRKVEQPTPSLRINTLRKQYEPGEEVTLGISLADSLGRLHPAELAIWAFDASLEAFEPYRMPSLQSYTPSASFRGFRAPYLQTGGSMGFYFMCKSSREIQWLYDFMPIANSYLVESLQGHLYGSRAPVAIQNLEALPSNCKEAMDNAVEESSGLQEVVVTGVNAATPKPAAPQLRSDFAETALWLPAEELNEKGETTVHFTLPHSLTRYKLALFAFNKSIQSYELVETFTVDKELSLTTNFPRYLREGDSSSIAATLSNKSHNELSGTVYLELLDAFTDEVLSRSEQSFSLAPDSNGTYSFALPYSEGRAWVKSRIVADAGTLSDGEERMIPQLTIRKPFVESLPFLLRGGEERRLDLTSLFSKDSREAKQRTLYIDVMGNPLWGALDELPLLLTTNELDAVSNALALYANSVAKSLLRKEPAFKRLLEIRATTGKHPESKLLTDPQKRIVDTEQTPFLQDALKEQTALDRLTLLLDSALMQSAEQKALDALRKLHNSGGGFGWLPGMKSSVYITKYVLYLLANMEDIASDSALQSIADNAYNFLQHKMNEAYQKEVRQQQYLSLTDKIDWLYLTALTHSNALRTKDDMLQAFFKVAKREIPRLSLKSLSRLIVALHAAGDMPAAEKAKKRLVEYLLPDGERGLTLSEGRYASFYGIWQQIRTQCAAIEALRLYPEENARIEEMKIWLLNTMRTTRRQDDLSRSMVLATLFRNAAPIMEYNGPVRVALSSGEQYTTQVDPTSSGVAAPIIKEQITLSDTEKSPQSITATKEGKGIAWGSVVATFTHPAQGIEASSNEELSVSRKLFRHITTENGIERLVPLDTLGENRLRPGDKITVELIIDAKEDLDYVVIRDMRSAALEPGIEVSGYRYNWPELSFYREIRDSEERFYLERLPKGLHRLSYEAVVDRRGHFFAGVTELQSVYAPDYSTHSAGKTSLVIE